MSRKRQSDPDLIHCTGCGAVIARKHGVTDGIILRCECGKELMVSVKNDKTVTVIELARPIDTENAMLEATE